MILIASRFHAAFCCSLSKHSHTLLASGALYTRVISPLIFMNDGSGFAFFIAMAFAIAIAGRRAIAFAAGRRAIAFAFAFGCAFAFDIARIPFAMFVGGGRTRVAACRALLFGRLDA